MGTKDPDYDVFERIGPDGVRKRHAEGKFNSRRQDKAPAWLEMKDRESAAAAEHHRRLWRMIGGGATAAIALFAGIQLLRSYF